MMKSPATVIVSAKAGRLGNRLILSAHFMANALHRGYRLINPALAEYAPFFEGSVRDPWCCFPPKGHVLDPEVAGQCREMAVRLLPMVSLLMPRKRLLDIRSTHDLREEVYDLNGEDYRRRLEQGGMLFVKGWKFRDHKNVVAAHHAIAEYLTPVKQIREKAERAVEKARCLGDFLIGVHIRQGDYRGWKGGIHYFETEQYAHWMSEAASLYPERRTSFLICASNPVNFDLFGNSPVVRGPGEVVADLHALSLCDAIMGPPSTFSSWASFHGRIPLCMLESHSQRLHPLSFTLHDQV